MQFNILRSRQAWRFSFRWSFADFYDRSLGGWVLRNFVLSSVVAEALQNLIMMVKVLAASLGCIGYLVWRQTSRKRIPQRMHIMTRCVQRERSFCSQRPDEFSIISYNILADCYCLNGYNASAYAYVHPQFLDWEYRFDTLQWSPFFQQIQRIFQLIDCIVPARRWPQLKEELAEFKADVICLQEVEVVRYARPDTAIWAQS